MLLPDDDPLNPITITARPLPTEDPVTVPVVPPPEPAFPGGAEAAAASFRSLNPTVNLFRNTYRPSETIQPGYSAWEEIKGTKYEAYQNNFFDSPNPETTAYRKTKIDREEEDRKIRQSAGMFGWVTDMAASVLDPTTLLPAGQIYRGGRAGYAIARSFASGAGYTALGTSLQEGALQATQETRSAEESFIGIGGSAILGGLLGATLSRLIPTAEFTRLGNALDVDMRRPFTEAAPQTREALAQGTPALADDIPRPAPATDLIEPNPLLRDEPSPQAAGAQAVNAPKETLDDYTIAGKVAEATARATQFTPVLRLVNSLSSLVRKTGAEVADLPTYLQMNFDRPILDDTGREIGMMPGRPSPQSVESAVKAVNRGTMADVADQIEALYVKYKKNGQPLNRDQFGEEVFKSGRRGDKHDNAEIQAAAQIVRNRIYEPLWKQAIGVGMAEPDARVKGAESYAPRVWDRDKITADPAGFNDFLTRSVEKHLNDHFDELKKNQASRISAIDQQIEDLTLNPEGTAVRLAELQDRLAKNKSVEYDALESSIDEFKKAAETARKSKDWERYARYKGEVERLSAETDDNYASYITARNADRNRIDRIRGNIVSRENKVEIARSQITDGEQANVERLTRLHRALSDIDSRIGSLSPKEIEGAINKAEAELANVLEKSDANLDRYAKAKQKAVEEAEAAGGADMKVIEEIKADDTFLKFSQTQQKTASDIASQIDDLKSIDPWEAMKNLNRIIVTRLNDTANLIEKESLRMQAKARGMTERGPEVAKARLKELQDRKERIIREHDARMETDPDYVPNVVRDITNTIMGRSDQPVGRNLTAKVAGPLKERAIPVRDVEAEPWLNNNFGNVLDRYVKAMTADIETARRFGSPDMSERFREIGEHFDELRAEAMKITDEKQRSKRIAALDKEQRENITDLTALRDMNRGVYASDENNSLAGRFAAGARDVTFIGTMGSAVASSLTDPGRVALTHGLAPTIAKGLAPLILQLKGIKLSAHEGKIAGVITERSRNSRWAGLAGMSDPLNRSRPIGNFINNAAKQFSKLTLLPTWTDWMKTASHALVSDHVLGNAEKGWAGLSRNERAYMNFVGLGEDDTARIGALFEKYGVTQDGIRIANTEQWPEKDWGLRSRYYAALNLDVDTEVISKGIGDVPLFANKPIGKTMFQFGNFAAASHTRTMIRGMQQGELGVDGGRMALAEGVISMVTIGMLQYYWHAVANNQLDDLSDNPGRWAAEAVDRSGIIPMIFAASNAIERATGYGIYGGLMSLWPDASQENKLTQYVGDGPSASITGAVGNYADMLYSLFSILKKTPTRGDKEPHRHITGAQANAFLRLLPGASLFYVNPIIKNFIAPPLKEAIVGK